MLRKTYESRVYQETKLRSRQMERTSQRELQIRRTERGRGRRKSRTKDEVARLLD